MSAGQPRVLTIPPGLPFLPTLVEALLAGRLVPGFAFDGDPHVLAGATIYLPTRRAARELRTVFVERLERSSAILPTIRPLGEVDEDGAVFDGFEPGALDDSPPIPALERVLRLAPLVHAWKKRLPAHAAARIGGEVVVPASPADAIWLARDLADLIDEVETEGANWSGLASLVPDELAGWWQVTLEFLEIVATHWPAHLAESGLSNPAAHRDHVIAAEAARLEANLHAGPIIAAGSTGTIPATARLLAAISRQPSGAVVLPGLDRELDDEAWRAIGRADVSPASYGHPQTALKRLLERLGLSRTAVEALGDAPPRLAARGLLVGEAMRPAETTDAWTSSRGRRVAALEAGALDGVSLVEAANEREEALAIAVALRLAVEEKGQRAALVTGDRALARRVSAELERFGILADDSGGTPLAATPPATLLTFLLEAVLRPGDPMAIHSLIGHPLLGLGLERAVVRRAAETIELVALRGGTGRPDIVTLAVEYRRRLADFDASTRKPFWLGRLDEERRREASEMLSALERAIAPLAALREASGLTLVQAARASVEALENLARSAEGGVANFCGGDAGDKLAGFLRELVASDTGLDFAPADWPPMLAALMAGQVVKPSPRGDGRVAIWGVLEARLQHVDTLVLGGLNEGSWPRRAEADRFMSRLMKAGLELEPPERRIGQAAHDFLMAMGTNQVVLTRSARAGDAPAVVSRWLQRLLACVEGEPAEAMRRRGRDLLAWARKLDERPRVEFAPRPCPTPPLSARPSAFSVTEIETLRRDPYAVYVRRVLGLSPLDPLIRDPGPAERGNLFHYIVHAFAEADIDPAAPDAVDRLIEIGRAFFDEADLPADIDAVWWPRFARMAGNFVDWDRKRPLGIVRRHAELSAAATEIGATGVTLRGRADRIDARTAGMADILDFKTGSSPTKGQSHTLLAPQLALEGALLMKGAFKGLGELQPAVLAHIRLKANGDVTEESILEFNRQARSGPDLSLDAWNRLVKLVDHYGREENGYLSRALPFRQNDMSGDFDHLARVLEWSAGADATAGEGGET